MRFFRPSEGLQNSISVLCDSLSEILMEVRFWLSSNFPSTFSFVSFYVIFFYVTVFCPLYPLSDLSTSSLSFLILFFHLLYFFSIFSIQFLLIVTVYYLTVSFISYPLLSPSPFYVQKDALSCCKLQPIFYRESCLLPLNCPFPGDNLGIHE